MAHASAAQRKLFMHPAHRTVGVFGEGIALHPYCRIGDFLADGPCGVPLGVALVVDCQDVDARASSTSFRQAIEQGGNVQCRCVERALIDAASQNLTDADCVVVFWRGLHIARRWAELDTVTRTSEQPLAVSQDIGPLQEPPQNVADNRKNERFQVEVAASARRHPILEGVGPLASRRKPVSSTLMSADATVLLVAKIANEDRPMAWLERGRHGPVFHTTLGAPEDFRQPDFVRLVLGVLTWIGR